MVEQEVTEIGKEFQIAGPADLKPREPNTGADMWDTETLSTVFDMGITLGTFHSCASYSHENYSSPSSSGSSFSSSSVLLVLV